MSIRLIFLLLPLYFTFSVSAQSIEEKITKRRNYGLDIPANAGDLLLQLYMDRSFDSIGAALAFMKKYSDEHPVEEFYLTTLLHIQQSTFSVSEVSDSVHFRLLLYPGKPVVNKYYKYDDWHFGYYEYWQAQLRGLVWVWAADILNSRRKLTDTEFFVCNALAGNYRHPDNALRKQQKQYPELSALLIKADKQERASVMGIVNLTAGMWIPRGNLKILGTHPGFGFHLGGRGKRNAIVLAVQFRFFKSANLYSVYRQDSLYQRNYYRGRYVGLEYTRYFYHTTRFEAGVVAGVGHDNFKIAISQQDEEPVNEHLKPRNIGSANLNAGLRLNYFFEPRFSVGIMPRYNAIWYKNPGGSSLSGQPFSIDVVLGR